MAECPGIYTLAEMKDGLLARLRVPGGRLSAKNLRAIATAANQYGNGTLDLTNRSNLQIRGIKQASSGKIIEKLIKAELITTDPVHDRLRNIAMDPLTGLVDEIYNCSDLVKQLDQALSNLSCRAQLSPKFSIVLDGGGRSHISQLPHDFAFVAKQTNEGIITFNVSINNQSTVLHVSPQELVEKAMKWIEKLCAFYQEENMRIKRLLKDHDLKTIMQVMEGKPFEDDTLYSLKSKLSPLMGLCDQIKTNKVAINLSHPTGRLFHFQLIGLAELAQEFGQGEVRLTPWQSIIMPHIDQDHIADIWEKGEALGFLTQEPEQNLQILSCAGSEGCIHGGFETKVKALKIRDAFTDMGFPNQVTIHLSACEKGCATRAKTPYLVLQRKEEEDMRLYVNEAPSTKAAGKPVPEEQLISELKKLI